MSTPPQPTAKHTAKHRSPPQNTAKHRKTPQPTAKHRKTPQPTAAHRKTPQPTAAHRTPRRRQTLITLRARNRGYHTQCPASFTENSQYYKSKHTLKASSGKEHRSITPFPAAGSQRQRACQVPGCQVCTCLSQVVPRLLSGCRRGVRCGVLLSGTARSCRVLSD